LIRYYGPYSGRTKGKAEKDESLAKSKFIYKPETPGDVQFIGVSDEYLQTVRGRTQK